MEAFTTPPVNRLKSGLSCDQSPVRIPETPAMKKLGSGTGVSVYSMTRSPSAGAYRSPWAIKKTNRYQEGLTEFDRRIKYEADVLKTINHSNIVGFRALTETHDGRKCLAMEECNVSLADLIEARFEENLGPYPVDIILKVALDISSALYYLHTSRMLLHGDLKSANILIKDDFKTAKLCDFGVCLPLRADGTADAGPDEDGYVGTTCWTAPEVLDGADGPTTSAADIFSFGLVLWEMLTLQPPHISALGEDPDASFDEEAYQKRIGTRPPLPPLGEEYKLIIDIFTGCTEMEFSKRPSALDIIKLLSTNIEHTQ